MYLDKAQWTECGLQHVHRLQSLSLTGPLLWWWPWWTGWCCCTPPLYTACIPLLSSHPHEWFWQTNRIQTSFFSPDKYLTEWTIALTNVGQIIDRKKNATLSLVLEFELQWAWSLPNVGTRDSIQMLPGYDCPQCPLFNMLWERLLPPLPEQSEMRLILIYLYINTYIYLYTVSTAKRWDQLSL